MQLDNATLIAEIGAIWIRLLEGQPADAAEIADSLLSPDDRLAAFNERYDGEEFIQTGYLVWFDVFVPGEDESGDPWLYPEPPAGDVSRTWSLCESNDKRYISPGIRPDSIGYYVCRHPWPHLAIQVDLEE